ncbi:MAG: hypothetical protein IT371_23580 [Deltaproteobacteria bacterium]|nr:hypothetical protein [Deltaproteobacteria bacterium]
MADQQATRIRDQDKAAFYRAALAGLRFVEARRATGRRFGTEADARWSSFRGDLTTAARVELMLRDADAEWPGAFGPRTTFALEGVAEDEPFGPAWVPLDPVDAEALFRDAIAAAAPASLGDALTAVARAWGLELRPFDVPRLDAADKLILCGPSAIAATIDAFARGTGLDWADQTLCVATAPAHRQLAALAPALLRGTRAASIVGHAHAPEKPASACRLILSEDADPADAAHARRLAG